MILTEHQVQGGRRGIVEDEAGAVGRGWDMEAFELDPLGTI